MYRTPDTLKSDDLADRSVILPVKGIGRDGTAERTFLDEAQKIRNQWWGAVLDALNRVIARIRNGELSADSTERMADWESLGRLIAKCLGAEKTWKEFAQALKERQEDFLLSGNMIADQIEEWLEKGNWDRELTTAQLYSELNPLDPRSGFPRTVSALGRQLSQLKEPLKRNFGMEARLGRSRTVYYTFKNGEAVKENLPTADPKDIKDRAYM